MPRKSPWQWRYTEKNRHYKWNEIKLRHWFDTAVKCNFPKEDMQKIIDEIFSQIDTVIDQVSGILPVDFPQQMADSIFSGIKVLMDLKIAR